MTTRKAKKKRAVCKHTRRQRREQYKAMMVTFILTGGHKDHIPPFSHNWKQILAYQTAAIETGNDTYTKPKGWYDQNLYSTSDRFSYYSMPALPIRTQGI